ncbi:unnamed protein product, partial [Medioppia subpectinata]
MTISLCLTYSNCIDVKTTSGVVRGQTIDVLNVSIDQFLGIPYAKPPVGRLRFAKPEPIKTPKPDIIDATKPKNSCTQDKSALPPEAPISEDCLVLNIWTPNAGNNNTNKSQLKPIMFWIHGGGYTGGSIFMDIYNGKVLATNDVMIVSTNYRLGPFGFLYGDREDAPGNVGLFDQLLALKWVRENAKQFGGDRDQITIFGESAGSWSVSTQIFSPLTKGLFKRAIMESGAIMYSNSRDPISTGEALQSAKDMAKHFNCSESEEWLHCLRELPADRLQTSTIFPTFPVLGTEYLPISAQKAFAEKTFRTDIDLLTGLVRDEGSNLAELMVGPLPNPMTVESFKQYINKTNAIYRGLDVQRWTDYYLQNVNQSDPQALRWAFYNFFGDITNKCPTYLFAKQFYLNRDESRNVYFYELTYENAVIAKLMKCDPETMGICHGMDIPYVFGLPLTTPGFTPEDQALSRAVMKMWTRFAKYGYA